jgi:hypothetical protein
VIGSSARIAVDIAFGLLVPRQPPERVQRKDKRLRHDEVISVSDRALEHRMFLSSAASSRRLRRMARSFSENRYPPRIKSGAGFFGIMH